jgi:ATP-dependent Clp protease ATP-binding subunit ClpC
MADNTMRVYFVTHHDGRLTGHAIRKWAGFWDLGPPTAYGSSEEEVLHQLQVIFQERLDKGTDQLERYLWGEPMQTQLVNVPVHPQKALKKRFVISQQEVPLRMTFAWCELPKQSGYHIVLPRFEWWFVVESLEMAPEVLRQAVSSALLGENARWIFAFREEGAEYVREWRPRLDKRRKRASWRPTSTARFPTLHAVAEELVDKARRRLVPGAVGDVDLSGQEALVLRIPPTSLLLVGPSGVGKSTWVRQLARQLSTWQRDDAHDRVPRLWATSADRIIAGMQYLGQWEQRCLEMIDELSQEGDYLYVDRLSDILRVRGQDHSSIGDLLAGPLRAGEISLIAECSAHEYERCRRTHPGFVDSFHVIRMEPPEAARMPALLQQYQMRKRADVIWSAAGLRQLVAHLDFFRRDIAFPGKGFRFLDWYNQAAEGAVALPEVEGADVSAPTPPTPGGKMLSAADASEAFSRYSGLPVRLIADEVVLGEGAIAAELAREVIGQDGACQQAARVLARFKAGLNDPERPCGSLFFVGPTGVGKTELAKALTRMMFGDEGRMIRLDMSEFMLPGSAQRLLWTGRGVKSLVEQVRQQPLTLILLDEIEKAHGEVFDLLLGALGEGRLTDDSGRLVDLRMALIVMTSNLGVRRGGGLGFDEQSASGATTQAAHDLMVSVRQHFRPEFFNRMDQVVPFGALTEQDLLKIVDLELTKAGKRAGLVRRHINLTTSPAARAELARLGYDPTRGARPLKRVVEERIITPLAIRLASDPTLRDRTYHVDLDGEGALEVREA